VELIQRNGRRARLRFDRRLTSASALITNLAARYALKDISVEEPEIEEIVRRLYQRSAEGGANGPVPYPELASAS
jgi:ABC-2 type transport system ATP-binding protein